MTKPKHVFIEVWTPDEVEQKCLKMYNSKDAWPMLDFLDQWKSGRVDAPTPTIVQIVCTYRNIVNARGPRAADKAAWIKRVSDKVK